jgi:hypothetical protein
MCDDPAKCGTTPERRLWIDSARLPHSVFGGAGPGRSRSKPSRTHNLNAVLIRQLLAMPVVLQR